MTARRLPPTFDDVLVAFRAAGRESTVELLERWRQCPWHVLEGMLDEHRRQRIYAPVHYAKCRPAMAVVRAYLRDQRRYPLTAET